MPAPADRRRTYCPYCTKTKNTLANAPGLKVVELDQLAEGSEWQVRLREEAVGRRSSEHDDQCTRLC